jgi:hypothetical protein
MADVSYAGIVTLRHRGLGVERRALVRTGGNRDAWPHASDFIQRATPWDSDHDGKSADVRGGSMIKFAL